MAEHATYNPALKSDRDWVRFLVGDRDVLTARLDDREIDALLSEFPNKYLAAANAGELMLLRGGITEKEVDGLRIKYDNDAEGAYKKYLSRLRQLGAQAMSPTPKIFRVL